MKSVLVRAVPLRFSSVSWLTVQPLSLDRPRPPVSLSLSIMTHAAQQTAL